MDMATGVTPVPSTGDKFCPSCGETIKAAAQVCRYCHTRFDLQWSGYCSGCHGIVDADERGACRNCSAQVADLQVRTALAGAETARAVPRAPTAAAPTAPTPPRREVPGASAASALRARRKRVIGFILALTGSLLTIGATFLDWLVTPEGRTVTGWDLYTIRSKAGDNVWVIPHWSHSLPFFTGLATLVAGVVLGAVTAVAMVIPRSASSPRFTVAAPAAMTLLAVPIAVFGFVIWNGIVGLSGVAEQGAGRVGLYLPMASGLTAAGLGWMLQRRVRGVFGRWVDEPPAGGSLDSTMSRPGAALKKEK
jgi:hypothetical protein